MTKTNEIVIFWTQDPHPYHESQKCPPESVKVCLRSIRSRSPSSHIVLLTDPHFHFGEEEDDIEYVRRDIRTEHLMYERERLYEEHLRLRHQQKSSLGITFMDVDIIVNKDLGEVFKEPFDIGLTVWVHPDMRLDERGIPVDSSLPSPINGGVIFCRPTEAAVEFFREHMNMYDRLHQEGGFAPGFSPDIRKWSGGQFAFMAMLGKEVVEKGAETVSYGNTLVNFFRAACIITLRLQERS